jgi:hypothetical protein
MFKKLFGSSQPDPKKQAAQ